MKKRVLMLLLLLLTMCALTGCGDINLGSLDSTFGNSIDNAFTSDVTSLGNISDMLVYCTDWQADINKYSNSIKNRASAIKSITLSTADTDIDLEKIEYDDSGTKRTLDVSNAFDIDPYAVFTSVTAEYIIGLKGTIATVDSYMSDYKCYDADSSGNYTISFSSSLIGTAYQEDISDWKKDGLTDAEIADKLSAKSYSSSTTTLRTGDMDTNGKSKNDSLYGRDHTIKTINKNAELSSSNNYMSAKELLRLMCIDSLSVRMYDDKNGNGSPSVTHERDDEGYCQMLCKDMITILGYACYHTGKTGIENNWWYPSPYIKDLLKDLNTVVQGLNEIMDAKDTSTTFKSKYVKSELCTSVTSDSGKVKIETKYSDPNYVSTVYVKSGSSFKKVVQITYNTGSDFTKYGLMKLDYNGTARTPFSVLTSGETATLNNILSKCTQGEVLALKRATGATLKKMAKNMNSDVNRADAVDKYFISTGLHKNLIQAKNGILDPNKLKAQTMSHTLYSGRCYTGEIYIQGLNKSYIDTLIGATDGTNGSRFIAYIDSSATDVKLLLTTYPIMRINEVRYDKTNNMYTFATERSKMYVNLLKTASGNLTLYSKADVSSGSKLNMVDDNVYMYDEDSIAWITKLNSAVTFRNGSTVLNKLGLADITGDTTMTATKIGAAGAEYSWVDSSSKQINSDVRTYALLMDYLEGLFMPASYDNENVLALGRMIRLDSSTLNSTTKIEPKTVIGKIKSTMTNSLTGADASEIRVNELISTEMGMTGSVTTLNGGTILGIDKVYTRKKSTSSDKKVVDSLIAVGETRDGLNVQVVDGLTAKFVKMNSTASEITIGFDTNVSDATGPNASLTLEYTGGLEGTTRANAKLAGEDNVRITDFDTTATESGSIIVKIPYGRIAEIEIGISVVGTGSVNQAVGVIVISSNKNNAGDVDGTLGTTGEASNYSKKYSDVVKVTELKTKNTSAGSALAHLETPTDTTMPQLFVMGHLYNIYDTQFSENWLKEPIDSDKGDGNLQMWCAWLKAKGYKNYPVNLDDIDTAITEIFNQLERVYNFGETDEDSAITFDPQTVAIVQEIMDKQALSNEAALIRTLTIIAGVIISLYGFMLLIAWAIDAGTTGEGDGILYVLSFKKMKTASEMSREDAVAMSTDGYKYVTFRMLLPRSIIIITVGIVLMAIDPINIVSTLIGYVDSAYRLIKDKFFNVR